MNRLFLDEIGPRDQTYRVIRDHLEGAEAKVFVEGLWSFYFPYADANFKSAIASSFHARFWEMYLAFGLAAQGAELRPTPPKGPDLSAQGLTHPEPPKGSSGTISAGQSRRHTPSDHKRMGRADRLLISR